ncbi:SDR family NAD(P)-dependent oxidoreductase [Janibacter sp. GXQ6167]|uniref:SDR family NAD(P)-dependent oxidoreductase n=1 Tax=Janibacter sp. GXQ6167 TaxID=3240791 RepID=UPI0035248B5F
MRIQGKVFIVTGGGSGIGREVVLGLLMKGARVAAVDLRAEALEQTAALAGQVERLSLHPLDVTDRSGVEAMVEEVIAAHGQLDGLLNVAGTIQQFVPILDLSYEEIERVMNVNFWGVVNTTKAALPHLLERPEAGIVNVSSMGGFTPVPGQSAYGASKAAVKLFTEGLYAEMRGTSVGVTVVFPGAIATEISTNSGVSMGERTKDQDSGAMPTTSAPDAAAAIIDGLEKGTYRILIGKDARALDALSRMSPRRATEMIAKKMADLLGR